jgi:hypothetical protein
MKEMSFPAKGSCQCGNITYQVVARPIATFACHCLDCQKLSTSSFSVSIMLDRSSFELLSGDLKSWKRPTAAGGIAVCWFCPDCGNRIYHENPDKPELIRLKPGTLEDTSVLNPMAHVWTCREQPWLANFADLPRVDKQPDLAIALQALKEGRSPF